MPVPNLPPRDAITGRFLEFTVKDTAKNLNAPAKVTKVAPLPPVPPPSLKTPRPKVTNPVPPPINRNAPARPPVPKKGR